MRLTENQLAVLAATELEADLNATQMARRAKIKVSTAQRVIQQLIELEVIAGRTAIVDLSRIGLVEYGFAIKLGRCGEQNRQQFERALIKHKQVSWLASVGGGFDYMLNITASDPETVRKTLNWISSQCPGGIVARELSIRLERLRFWRGYLGAPSRGVRFHLGQNQSKLQLSEIDLRVLASLSNLKFESFRESAAASEIPIATYLRRLSMLKEQKILLGFAFRLNLDRLGISQFRIFLKTFDTSGLTCKQLVEICASSKISKLLTVNVGDWDFEMEVDTKDIFEAKTFLQKVENKLEERLLDSAILPIFKHLKFISFPVQAKVV